MYILSQILGELASTILEEGAAIKKTNLWDESVRREFT